MNITPFRDYSRYEAINLPYVSKSKGKSQYYVLMDNLSPFDENGYPIKFRKKNKKKLG